MVMVRRGHMDNRGSLPIISSALAPIAATDFSARPAKTGCSDFPSTSHPGKAVSELQHFHLGGVQPVTGARRVALVLVGLIVLFLCALLAAQGGGLWLPSAGVGLALIAWSGQPVAVLVILDIWLARLLAGSDPITGGTLGDCVVLGAEMAFSWWAYARLAKGSRTGRSTLRHAVS